MFFRDTSDRTAMSDISFITGDMKHRNTTYCCVTSEKDILLAYVCRESSYSWHDRHICTDFHVGFLSCKTKELDLPKGIISGNTRLHVYVGFFCKEDAINRTDSIRFNFCTYFRRSRSRQTEPKKMTFGSFSHGESILTFLILIDNIYISSWKYIGEFFSL